MDLFFRFIIIALLHLNKILSIKSLQNLVFFLESQIRRDTSKLQFLPQGPFQGESLDPRLPIGTISEDTQHT